MRKAVIYTDQADVVARFLPSNYSVISCENGETVIAGEDSAGWGLDNYVLPRLASGLLYGRELLPGS